MFKKANRFVVERRAEAALEFRDPMGADAARVIKLIEAEPLPKEFRSETASFWIVQHSPGLVGKLLWIAQLASTGRPTQLLVRQRRPNQKAQPAGQFTV